MDFVISHAPAEIWHSEPCRFSERRSAPSLSLSLEHNMTPCASEPSASPHQKMVTTTRSRSKIPIQPAMPTVSEAFSSISG